MTSAVREPIRPLCPSQITMLLEQRTEVEGAVGLAALVGASVAGLRRTQVAARFVEHAEIQRRAGMAQCVGFAVGKFSAGRIAALFEQNPEAELLNGSTTAIDQCVCAPHHLPAFPTVLSDQPTSTHWPIESV